MLPNRYVTAGAAWFSGAFSKVARVGQVAGSKTKEKFNLAVSNMSSKVSHQTNPHLWKSGHSKAARNMLYIYPKLS